MLNVAWTKNLGTRLQIPESILFAGKFEIFMDNNQQIEWTKTTPYHPSSNGQVERMNSELRKRIRIGISSNIRNGGNNNFEWSAHLQDYVDNINS